MNPPKIYSFLPIWAQNVAVNLKGWRIQRTRYNKDFRKMLEEWEKRLFWPEDKIDSFKNERLRYTINHCYNTVPYYREIFDKLKLKPSDVSTVADLQKLGIINKKIVNLNREKFISRAVNKRKMQSYHTSGTTGAGFHFVATMQALQAQWVTWWRYRRHHRINFGTWVGEFGQTPIVPPSHTRPPFWRTNIFGHEVRFSNSHMNSKNLPFYFAELERREFDWLHGYPSLLMNLANFMINNGLKLSKNVKWVTIGAENLLPSQIDSIRKALGVKPIQHYGNAEGIANISECPDGSLHVDEDYAVVEFIKDDEYEGNYRIIGTTLWNDAMPLLRYDIGDMAVLSNRRCSCGRMGRIVESLNGRQEDYVVCSDGSRVSCFNQCFIDFDKIEMAQIRQRRAGHMIVSIVRYPGFKKEHEKGLLADLRKRVSESQMEIEFEYVESIARTASGKQKLVISEIEDAKIE